MSIIGSIEAEFRRYKALADSAIAQLTDDAEVFGVGPGDSNSVDMLMRHIAGNLRSRFSDFRTADGEKPWRRRDDEFEPTTMTRLELIEYWEGGWQILFDEIAKLTDDDLTATVTIRRQPLRIDEALHRSVTHAAYHVGQIVYLAKAIRAGDWRCLSIPKGASEQYNQNPTFERPSLQAEALSRKASER